MGEVIDMTSKTGTYATDAELDSLITTLENLLSKLTTE